MRGGVKGWWSIGGEGEKPWWKVNTKTPDVGEER